MSVTMFFIMFSRTTMPSLSRVRMYKGYEHVLEQIRESTLNGKSEAASRKILEGATALNEPEVETLESDVNNVAARRVLEENNSFNYTNLQGRDKSAEAAVKIRSDSSQYASMQHNAKRIDGEVWSHPASLNDHTRGKGREIRIVIYHFYHTLLRRQIKNVKMSKCYHYVNCKVVGQQICSEASIDADAIVFQGNNIPRVTPNRLNSNQAFVFLNIESPQYLHYTRLNSPKLNDFFNWTMTYRLDSDIPYLYGAVLPSYIPLESVHMSHMEKQTADFINFRNYESSGNVFNSIIGIRGKDYRSIFRRKSKSSVWFVSHCRTASGRERYISQMQPFTHIDIYGTCSNITNACPKRNPHCNKKMKDTYKFFIAFENSLCDDYITEKVFRWFEEDIIIVVRGARHYAQYLPKGAYIDADDFTSPADLGKYLTKLGSDEDAYLKYLMRKDQYSVVGEQENVQIAFCNLCYKLNNLDQFRKSAAPLEQWWTKGKCINPSDIV